MPVVCAPTLNDFDHSKKVIYALPLAKYLETAFLFIRGSPDGLLFAIWQIPWLKISLHFIENLLKGFIEIEKSIY